ncbi:MAG: ABC transporter ATP-binding protein [Chlamydiales bacterium]
MILKAKHIAKSYLETTLFSDLSLTLEQSESIAICGRSGIGKTTLLHILGTLEEPDSGDIEIGGERLTRSSAPRIRNQQIGFIFQAYNLLEDFTALENVLMPARIARSLAPRLKGVELLALVGLEAKADCPAKLLSGGERQRVAIARALCNDPNLILADEPTGNLDRATGGKIGELLISLKKAVIIVTHDPEIAGLCDRQYLLQDGRLAELE